MQKRNTWSMFLYYSIMICHKPEDNDFNSDYYIHELLHFYTFFKLYNLQLVLVNNHLTDFLLYFYKYCNAYKIDYCSHLLYGINTIHSITSYFLCQFGHWLD